MNPFAELFGGFPLYTDSNVAVTDGIVAPVPTAGGGVSQTIGQAVETETARQVFAKLVTDWGPPVEVTTFAGIDQATETDTALPIVQVGTVTLTGTIETGVQVAGSFTQTQPLTGQVEAASNISASLQTSIPVGVQFDTNVRFKVGVAFGVNPYSTVAEASWKDVSKHVRAVDTVRGRTNELTDIPAGQATVLLDNRDRRFDPTNTASTYYPNIKPMTPIRIQAVYGGTTYGVFSGHVESWPQTFQDNKYAQETPMTAIDGFRLFSFTETATTHAQELSGARVNAYLDEVGWPAGRRSVANGQITVDTYQGQCSAVLEEIKRAEQTEHGLFFIDGDGNAVFQSSTYRNGGTPASTFSDTGQVPYVYMEMNYDDYNIWNDVTVQGVGVAAQAVQDTGSIDSYGRRKLHVFDTLHTNATGAQDYGNQLLGTYKNPQLRIETMEVMPRSSPAEAWTAVLESELSDYVRVKRNPTVGSTMVEHNYVESVSHSWNVEQEWVTTFSLSPST